MPAQALPLVLFVAFAALLFAAGHLLARRRRMAPARIPARRHKTMMTLKDAAKAAYEAARRERMVIVTVAERMDSDPATWFASSIAGVVAVYRRGDDFERVTEIGTAPEALYIRREDFDTYVRWARSMQ